MVDRIFLPLCVLGRDRYKYRRYSYQSENLKYQLAYLYCGMIYLIF